MLHMRARLEFAGSLVVSGGELAIPETLALLEGISERRTLRGAAEGLGLSYRSAWDRLRTIEKNLGRNVVVKTKGHGTALTPFGRELREALSTSRARLAAALEAEQSLLEAGLASLAETRVRPLRIATSHDPLLARVLSGRTDVDVAVTGSEAALRRLAAGDVDVAGCHFGGAEPDPSLAARWSARPIFRREQGLILGRGNPLGIASLADLVRKRARLINRQRDSGTRAWLDRMLAGEGLDPRSIVGYASEEFTHQAVAATVAAGGADAGLGVRAAADALGLAFVPLGIETFFLVADRGLASPVLDEVAQAAASLLEEFGGYSSAGGIG
ncbi:substrate-binding domain-containing protein [Enterovirga aerilata]|uniref:Helix-turn-helix transcriptional regulator n=1 Tax=Enterovirga aerilata TaxID=2730920 RepID=A0A849IBS2_9HYPH|nr:substrate-binding domain-containing protein [Enterovirga sp. DB1703]NNM74731.1 helix-turn-helix transcriptional regulator [Enterovirga sp. DB1703]